MEGVSRVQEGSLPIAIPLAIAGSAVLGAAISSRGAQSAANTQAAAADRASQVQLDMYNMTRGDLAPYRTQGGAATNALAKLLGLGPGGNPLTSPLLKGGDAYKAFQPTIAQLEKTPGYQFTRNQGLKAVQNSAAARGLGISGAAQKGAAAFATGLAENTYQQNYDRYVNDYLTKFNADTANQTNAFNRLLQVGQLGENAAAQTGSAGVATGQGIGQNITGAANAQGAAQVAGANAAAGAIGSIGNSLLLSSLLRGGSGGAGAGGLYGPST